MAITAKQVKELREMTGAGMMDCKKALTATEGDFDKAIEFLREKGLATAEKKAGRVAAEGLVKVIVSDDKKKAVAVEVNAETDFVAKNEKFQNFVKEVAQHVVTNDCANVDEFLASPWGGEFATVQDALNDMISVIGEKLSIRRFEKYTNDGNTFYVSYIHAGGKIAVIVEFATDSKDAALVECGKNVAMQIAAMNPKYVAEKDVPADFIEHEKALLLEQAKNDPKNAGKPENILEKMLTGRLKKEMKEICLLDQEYVQGDKESVAQYIQNVAKSINTDVQVKGFVRFETGEGIEKKEENFADEVAKAMN